MDNIFSSMEHIEIDMACQWLCRLIDSPFPLSSRVLMELCEQYSTPVYIDCSALEGVIAPLVGSSFVVQQVIGIELCQVESPACAFEAFDPHKSGGINVTGKAVVLSDREESEGLYVHSWILTNQEGRPFLFRPDDIKRLASFLKPDQEGLAEEADTSRGSKNDDRLKLIRKWFSEQQEYTASHFSEQNKGLPGPRDSCWRWCKQLGLTAPGKIFDGALQKNSGKTKKFVNAWNTFLEEMTRTRPKN